MQAEDGRTALICASVWGRLKLSKALLNSPLMTDVFEMQDKYGNTALMFASQSGHTEIAQALLNVH